MDELEKAGIEKRCRNCLLFDPLSRVCSNPRSPHYKKVVALVTYCAAYESVFRTLIQKGGTTNEQEGTGDTH